jgi:two-component system sensor histidine kinase UhpB
VITKNNPIRLLVIEDNTGDLLLLQEYLSQSRIPVAGLIHAENMASVPSLIKDYDIDVALLDLTLPDSNGIDSVITLDRLLPKTPIIVLSGQSAIEVAMESISLGAQDYLVKGDFDEKLLAKCIHYSIERKKILEKLQTSNERYEFVNKATLDAIWDWDFNTARGLWGNGIIETFGYPADSLQFKKEWLKEYVHPEEIERVEKFLASHIENNLKHWQDEFRFRVADGSYKDVIGRGYILYNLENKPYRMFGAVTDITKLKKLEAELATQQINQQKLITEINIQAQEKERNELGKELHDNINQILATVKMYLGMTLTNKNPGANLLEKSYEYVNLAMEEIRKLSKSLVAPSLGDMGLKGSLESLVDELNVTAAFQVDLNFAVDAEQKMEAKKELMLYRIVQEQMNNIVKHANAQKVRIGVSSDEGLIRLLVTDDGIGFDTSQKADGIGLENIRSRVQFYSGNMEIISDAGKGCRLDISIPY